MSMVSREKGLIEVYHVKPLSTIGEEIVIDSKNDLVPICLNCHTMIHRSKDNIFSVEKLRGLVQRKYIIKRNYFQSIKLRRYL